MTQRGRGSASRPTGVANIGVMPSASTGKGDGSALDRWLHRPVPYVQPQLVVAMAPPRPLATPAGPTCPAATGRYNGRADILAVESWIDGRLQRPP